MTRAAAQVGIILLTALVLFLAAAWRPVQATDNAKWFVCKYEGTPGVDERLQTGDNPISVSENAIPVQPVVPGAEFSDQQGRSIVLVEDTGQPEPDPSECPPPDTGGSPTPSPSPVVTPTPEPTASPTPAPTATPTPSEPPVIDAFRVLTCPVTGQPIPPGMSAIEFEHPLLLLILLQIRIDGALVQPIPVETASAFSTSAVAAVNAVEVIVEPGTHDWSISDSDGNLLASGTIDCPVCVPETPTPAPKPTPPPEVPDTAMGHG